jgi:hypothetical protein
LGVVIVLVVGISSSDARPGNPKEPVCTLRSAGDHALAIMGRPRKRISASSAIVDSLLLVDQGALTSGVTAGDLSDEDFPNVRVVCRSGKAIISSVEPIVLPRGHSITWFDYEQRELTLDGERRVVSAERLVFVPPVLAAKDIESIDAAYRQLESRSEEYHRSHRLEVETLLGQVFLWALQDPIHGTRALSRFAGVFHLDGAYGEAESNCEEMYQVITGHPL